MPREFGPILGAGIYAVIFGRDWLEAHVAIALCWMVWVYIMNAGHVGPFFWIDDELLWVVLGSGYRRVSGPALACPACRSLGPGVGVQLGVEGHEGLCHVFACRRIE